jgi:hypothetical protein
MVPWHWSHFTPEVVIPYTAATLMLRQSTLHQSHSTSTQVFRNFARSALRDIDVLGDSFRYGPTRFSRTFCGGFVTMICIVATFGIIAASSYQFHTSPRVFIPADRAIVVNSLAFETPSGSNSSTRIAISDECDLPTMIYTLKILVGHYETLPTQIRRVTVTDRRKFGLRTQSSDITTSSSDALTAPNFALSSAIAVPLGSFNDFVQASALDVSFSVTNALASKASRNVDSEVPRFTLKRIFNPHSIAGSTTHCRVEDRPIHSAQSCVAHRLSQVDAQRPAILPAAGCARQHRGFNDWSGYWKRLGSAGRRSVHAVHLGSIADPSKQRCCDTAS